IGRWNWLAVPCVCLGTTIGLVLTICAINLHYYHMFGVVEVKEKNFQAAMGALLRPIPDHWQPRIPVPRETWQRLYAVSPAFAELKPALEGPPGDLFARAGERAVPESAGTREIAGGW